MTLFKALSQSEEMNCKIVNRVSGHKLRALPGMDISSLPTEGWELCDELMPVTFEATFMGCPEIDGMMEPVTTFLFRGNHKTLLPAKTKVKVTLEPIDS